jgi:hypothetical protein
MIKTETKIINGKEFVYNYSDESKLIKKVGTEEIYESAYDLPEKGYVYEETEEVMEEEQDTIDEN